MESNKVYIKFYFKIELDGEEMYAAQNLTIDAEKRGDKGVNLKEMIDGFKEILATRLEIPAEYITVVSKEEHDQWSEEQ